MTKVTCQITVSLDGFMAGPEQSEEDPLGVGGERLHEWMFAPDGRERDPVDEEVARTLLEGNGAYVMGRNMFGPVRGGWSGDWRGWWGEAPPYHVPVYVLTHHAREPLEMEGGTVFHFVTDGFDAAMARAREAAGPDANVCVAGGASTIRQALEADVLDELHVHYAPITLGGGELLFAPGALGDARLEVVASISSPYAAHVRYQRAIGTSPR